ncbi:Hydroxyacid-oxoacid transhydrogenase; mitochondrial [Camelus dromedarius]|uniref:Hydroxyacid-oxoacid transhydrogenase, mitochondrial n=1 Tax=Camelus dromedarius TaxID=9838 RepID=A0A5N4CCQ5_CAMDR|nr:Hydroxyacid-oxoacid transhydrogenase; mitochondrial [Camelus dromedarius]
MEGQNVEELLAKAERDEAEKLQRITVHKELELEFDLGNLLALDRNPPTGLRHAGPTQEAELRALARDNTQLLINQLWQLPTERVEEALVARLPEPTTRLPREKPVPRPRPLTRWQQFARLKGIRPKKKTNLVWDEVSGQWRRRWGYQRARDDTKEWLIEVPGSADPMEDQFAKRIQAKKERVAKNELNRLRNLARAHKIQLPSATGMHPTGHQSKEELGRAMQVARVSTASVGRFQERLPKEKAPRGSGKKRKFQPLFGDFAAEKKSQLEMLRVMNSKKPQMDVTRATNKQMREEDQEEAAKRRKMSQKGKRKGGRQGPGDANAQVILILTPKDLQNMGAKNVCLMTDKNLSQLPPVKTVMDSLVKNGINFKLYDSVRVEPTDRSFMEAVEFAKKGAFDAYVAVGGGSTMDTCKAANLYASSPHSDFLDYVNAPIGKGKPVTVPLRPLIAVPTTSGTGSETTGVAIFDYEHLKVKTGIASRAIKPTLGLIDPLHTLHMPERVVANSGFDVLCHALESYTALPYHMRSPCPSNPITRPAYQGSNPISDIWAVHALQIVAKYLKRSFPKAALYSVGNASADVLLLGIYVIHRAVRNPDDLEARSNMHLASAFAGIGFGNAGVHLCHGMSYPISGLVKKYKAKDYKVDHPLVARFTFCPAAFAATSVSGSTYAFSWINYTVLSVAEQKGADTRTARIPDAGPILADTLRKFLFDLDVDDGLAAIGYSKADIPALVKGTLPQERVTKLAPRPQSEEDLSVLFEASMKLY